MSAEAVLSAEALGEVLLGLARRSLEEAFSREDEPLAPEPWEEWAAQGGAGEEWLSRPGATFVTLFRDGQLRGCVGSILPRRPIVEDVWDNARSAAFRDPRFPPVEAEEVSELVIEVSLLSPLEPMEVGSLEEACGLLRQGVDGVVLERGPCRGVFLPQVWDRMTTPEQFLSRLAQKAGLPAEGYWAPDLELWRFTVREWHEGGGVVH